MNSVDPKQYLPRPQVAKRYGVTERSIARWQIDPTLRFPEPMEVNGRLFFALDDLEVWERGRASRKPAAEKVAA